MPVRPLIVIKAGRCLPSPTDPKNIVPSPEPGLLYIYNNTEDEFPHFCWKPRSSNAPPVEDLLIIPYDATFVPYPSHTGRIFILKFSSSSQRYFYWLQSKSERADDPGFMSNRDKEWGRRINRLLQGEEDESGADEDLMGDDDDEVMEDIERRDDGADAREGGADGGRAPVATAATHSALPPSTPGTNPSQQDFLASLVSSISVPTSSSQQQSQSVTESKTIPLLLPDLLTPTHTVPILSTLTPSQISNLASLLPPSLFPENATPSQIQAILKKVLHSPQFSQSLGSLTAALRDEGGLRGVCDSLGVGINKVAQEVRRNGGDLVGGFVEGVRDGVEKEQKQGGGGTRLEGGDRMELE